MLQEELRGKYGPDVNVDFLIDFMRRHRDQPFMVYYTSLLPHYPWEPTPDSDDPLKPADGLGDTKHMPDMVACLDKQVGRIVAAVDELGLSDRTVIIFSGDNGTDRRIRSKWTDGNVSRTVAGGKGTMTDAGTRVPLIAAWPGVVKPGAVCDDLIDFSDFLPTFVELGRAKPSPLPVNGRSFAAQLRGEKGQPRRWIHVQDHDKRYVRSRDFILTSDGKLRPVTQIGQPENKPLAEPLEPSAEAARHELQAALKAAAFKD